METYARLSGLMRDYMFEIRKVFLRYLSDNKGVIGLGDGAGYLSY